jgi:hypothetical protein
MQTGTGRREAFCQVATEKATGSGNQHPHPSI